MGMPLILATCPTTSATVTRGQHASPAEFERADELSGRYRCDACGKIHDWTKADVRLVKWQGATSTLG